MAQETCETIARLLEQEKQVDIESKKAEVLERRARAAKDRAEAEKLSIETVKQKEETEKFRLENEQLRLELQSKKIQLIFDIIKNIEPSLPEAEKITCFVKLHSSLEALLINRLEIIDEQKP